jgi:thiol:disulfide interchange protein DsbD
MIRIMRPKVLLAVLLLCMTCASSALAQGVALGGALAPTISAALNYQSLPAGQQAVIAVVIDTPPGYHVQSHNPIDPQFIALDVSVKPSPSIKSFAPIYPTPEIKQYPALGQLSIYEGRTIVYIPIQVRTDAAQGLLTIEGTVQYQMCNDQACFPPATPAWSIHTNIAASGAALVPNQPDLFQNFDPSVFARLSPAIPRAASVPSVRILGHNLAANSYLFAYFAAFIIGIIFNIVPCVLPVVPLKIMGFYEVSQHHRARSFAFGVVFSLGIVLVFAILGLLVVVFQTVSWGQMFGNVWFLAAIVAILFIFGVAQFGAFSVGLPTAIYNVTPRHDTYIGNFLFGILTAILSTPCTFGMFLVLLVWAAAQPWAIGLTLLIVVGIGMAFPYLVLSAFPEIARRFPRSGPWAELVKQMMGFLLIGSAVFFARRFLNPLVGEKVFWWLLFAVVAIAALYLIVRTIQFSRTAIGPLIAVVLAALLVAPSLAFTIRQTNPPIDWQPYTSEAVDAARKDGRVVMVEFTADWCANCLTLEATTFHNPQAVQALRQHEVLTFRADLTDQSAPGWTTLRHISPIAAIPLTAIYAPNHNQPIQLTGIYSAADLVNALATARHAQVAANGG